MKILVAEDNAVTAVLMTGILNRHGYTVVLARNGSEALRLLGSEPDIQGVITDIMMPDSSGLDLLRALRAHETWRNLPTIVTTVRDDRETVAEAVAFGCKEYLLKPVGPAHLIERVRRVFRQEKVILMSSAEVISRYSLTPETYLRITKNFAIQVGLAITDLQSWSKCDTDGPRVDYVPLMESATLLGAERLMGALEKACPVAGSSLVAPLQCASLLEELQHVHEGLSSLIGRSEEKD